MGSRKQHDGWHLMTRNCAFCCI